MPTEQINTTVESYIRNIAQYLALADPENEITYFKMLDMIIGGK